MIAILVAVLMAAAAGVGGVAVASNGAGPGDALYGVDQAVESVSLGLTTSPERAVERELAFAEERLDEAEALVGEDSQEEDFEEALQNYGQTISQIVHLLNSSEEVDEEALNALLGEALAHHEERLRRIFDLQEDAEDDDADGTDLDDEEDVEDEDDVDDEDDEDDAGDEDDEDDADDEDDEDDVDDEDDEDDVDDEDDEDDADDEDDEDDVDDEDDEDDVDDEDADRCTGNDPHPAGEKLAAEYDVEYDEVMEWFCDGFGFGEIVLAIEAADQAEMEIDEVLDMKGEDGGWGRVMQELGLIGKNRRSADDDEDEATEEAAPRGNGRESAPGQNKEKSNNGRGSNK